MWSATEPKVFPEISTYFYPCAKGLFGKQPDKWLNVLEKDSRTGKYEDFDIESKFGMVCVEDINENSASFISSDNRHFHGGVYPLKNRVYQCGNEVEPDLPYPVVGVGFQRDELIVACLISTNNIGLFKLETNDNNIDEWGIVGTIYNENLLFLNHVYFSKDGTKAATIATKVKEYERTPYEKEDIYIPYLCEITLSYTGQATYQINENETTVEHSYIAPFTIKFKITAPFAVDYINSAIKTFKSEIEFIAGDYGRELYFPAIEGVPYWNANYYYAYWNCETGEHWRVSNLYWWQYGSSSCPGLSIGQYQTTGSNEIKVSSGNVFSYKISFSGLKEKKSIYTTKGLRVDSMLLYSTLGIPGYIDAPFFGPLAKIDLHAIVPRIPDFLDGLFTGKSLGVTNYFLAGNIYSIYDTGYSQKTYTYNIQDYTTRFVFYEGSGSYVNNRAIIHAQGTLLDTLDDTFEGRESGLGTGISKRNVLLLVDLKQDLFVFGGKFGIKVIKNGQVIKELNDNFEVGRGEMFIGNQFDGEKDGIWGNIGIKYASKNQDYLLQIGNNNAIFNGNDINFKFEQIGVS